MPHTNFAPGALQQPAEVSTDPATWGARNAHDPTAVRDDDGTYYLFSTDAVANSQDIPAGVHIRTSTDLVHWTYLGTAFDGVPAPAADWSGAQGLWAPEVVRWPGDGWHMYYSASTFGSNTSAIGLAIADSPAGPWEDLGLVVATRAGEQGQNAIDAAVTLDRNGQPWLTYGSFFSGIYTLPLDPASGRPLHAGDLGTCVARRDESVDRAIEGAFILYRPEEDRYVLFCSFDSLFSTYNIRVAVADHITGPYRDHQGRSLTDDAVSPALAGTKVLGSCRFRGGTGWLAPGHNSVLTQAGPDGSTEYFLVHHVRFADAPGQHEVQVRRMFFTTAGWPVVSPQPYAGNDREILPAPVSIAGCWQVLRFDPLSTETVHGMTVRISCAGSAAPEPVSAGAAQQLRLTVHDLTGENPGGGVELDAVIHGSWDWARSRAALSFSGIDSDGVVWSGTREDWP